jgi:protein involved in polysaccharide export with SLBB domain
MVGRMRRLQAVLVPLVWFLSLPQGAWGQTQTESRTTPLLDITRVNAIGVAIGGSFPVTGTFAASPMERVDQFVTRQYAATVELSLRRAALTIPSRSDQPLPPVQLPEYPKRGIRLKRAGGEEIAVDLERFRLTGDYTFNPYLRSDDLLIFPEIEQRFDFFSVSGSVNKPGRVQFVAGDRLNDAILFGGGLRPEADHGTRVMISRLDSTGQQEDTIWVNQQENPLLKRGDRIWVTPVEYEKRDFRVTVSGEVNRPGSIPITKSSTTIREVIERAGGFKPSADKWRTELIRGANVFQSLFFTEQFENLMMLRSADISLEDSLTFAIDNRLRFQRGNGLIDFSKLDSSAGDFIVRDGDYVFVPEAQKLVYVFGQVSSPGYVPYVPGLKYSDYIQRAGGVTPTAKDVAYLISGKSRAWARIDDGTSNSIEPGDYIWVAKTPRRPIDFWLTRIGAVAQIIGAVATVIILVKQF